MTQPQESTNPPSELIQVTDLHQMAQLIALWHENQCQMVQHFLEVPEGAEFKIGEGAQEETIVLQGDTLRGFKFGIEMAMMQLGTLPIALEFEADAEEPAIVAP